MVAPCVFILVLNAFRREEVVSVLILPAPAASSGKGKAREISASRRRPTLSSSSAVRLSARQKRPNFLLDGERATGTEAGEALPKVATKISRFFYHRSFMIIGRTGTRTAGWI